MIIQADAKKIKEIIADSTESILLDFRAEWCGPCQMLTPVLEEISREFPAVKIIPIDVDQCPELAAEYNIDSIPALFLIKSGTILKQTIGYMPKDKLIKVLNLQ